MTEQLRIGNRVLIDGLEQDVYALIHSFDNTVNGWRIEEVTGIPLTEEWLIKIGFVKLWHLSNYQYVLRIDLLNMEFNVTLKKDRSENAYATEHKFWITDDSFTTGYGEMETKELHLKIEHVHQLQNLYWCLCGEELTIV